MNDQNDYNVLAKSSGNAFKKFMIEMIFRFSF